MKLTTFVFINFVVSLLSDIILNDLANPPKPFPLNSQIINSLKSYFQNKSIIVSGVYAGLTICLTLIFVSLISKYILGFYVPKSYMDLMKYCAIAFPIGFVVDIFIDKMKIFGNSLNKYYKIAGAGWWGAIAFIFSIVISWALQKYIVPEL